MLTSPFLKWQIWSFAPNLPKNYIVTFHFQTVRRNTTLSSCNQDQTGGAENHAEYLAQGNSFFIEKYTDEHKNDC